MTTREESLEELRSCIEAIDGISKATLNSQLAQIGETEHLWTITIHPNVGKNEVVIRAVEKCLEKVVNKNPEHYPNDVRASFRTDKSGNIIFTGKHPIYK